MCPACQAEYLDPSNRRFHAQPNACWECGPKLEIWDSTGLEIKGVDPIAHAILRLQAGHIVAVKGLGGFHLAADATNIKAICLLRDRKRRVEKPFAIMVKSLSQAEQLCQVSRAEAQVLQSIERPIVLLRRREPSIIPDQIAPFQRHLGVFLPYTPVHHLLFAEGGFQALIMTSGNLSEEPIAIDNHEARTRLRDLADYFLVHNREILLRCDDSVVRVARERSIPNFAPPLPSNLASEVLARGARRETLQYFPVIRHIRRSRGFVPVPVFLDREIPSVLAVGGQLKNTVCLTQRDQAFLSQHVGDLENLESYKFFGEAIDHLRRILEISPEILAHDLHPGYFCTHWSLQQKGFRRIGVQHHHAHVASCMAENQLAGDVVGIALDGTGYGTDGKIWGGEVLLANYKTFKRAAHFEYAPMPGGEAAVREPWRMALGYLAHHFGRELVTFKLPFLERLGLRNVELLLQMIDRQVNSPLTSSCGRLFDAVAALAEVRQSVNYEAQAAIELEMVINDSSPEEVYPFELLPADDAYIIGTRPLFAALIEDIAKQTPVGIISLRFHNGLVELFLGLAKKLRQQTNFDRICLSGGSFNNVYLAEHLGRRLKADGFQVFTHSQVPAGDGGLSLGQAMIAAHQAP